MMIYNFKIWTGLPEADLKALWFVFRVVVLNRRGMVIFDYFVMWVVVGNRMYLMVFFHNSRLVIFDLMRGSVVVFHGRLVMILHWFLVVVFHWLMMVLWLVLYVVLWCDMRMSRLYWVMGGWWMLRSVPRESFCLGLVAVRLHLAEPLLLSVNGRGSVVVRVALRRMGLVLCMMGVVCHWVGGVVPLALRGTLLFVLAIGWRGWGRSGRHGLTMRPEHMGEGVRFLPVLVGVTLPIVFILGSEELPAHGVQEVGTGTCGTRAEYQQVQS